MNLKENRDKNIIIIKILVSSIIAGCVIAIGVGIWLFKYEKEQRNIIRIYESEIIRLRKQLDGTDSFEWPDNTYNYLALGNSITYHDCTNYWWNRCGMAASTAEQDYFHLISERIKAHEGKITSKAYNFSAWETLEYDRAETIDIIKDYISEKLNLVTIQLGENVYDTNTFEEDFEYLIGYISANAPNAKIIVIGNFWSGTNSDQLKKKVSEKCGVIYIDLSEIKDNKDYQAGLKAVVMGDDGESHLIEHLGVSKHPNDRGMEYIAEKLLEELY